MWICPKCEIFNRDGDLRCYVCGCEYKVYLYRQSLKIEEPVYSEPEEPETAVTDEEINPDTAASTAPGSKTREKADEHVRTMSEKADDYLSEYHKAERLKREIKKKRKTKIYVLLSIAIAALVIFLCARLSDSSANTKNSALQAGLVSYGTSAEYNDNFPDQVIECQNETVNLYFR